MKILPHKTGYGWGSDQGLSGPDVCDAVDETSFEGALMQPTWRSRRYV